MIADMSGIANHLKRMDKSIFPNLTRAGLINKQSIYDNSILVPFVKEKLFFETKGQIPQRALNAGYDEWLLGQGITKRDHVFDLSIDVMSVSVTLFNRRLVKERKDHFGSKLLCIVGVRWREPTDPSQDSEINSFVMENDIWESIRGISPGPFYKIQDFQKDFIELNTLPTNQSKYKKVEIENITTDAVQKQYLSTNLVHKPLDKAKSEGKQEKPKLVFAKPKFPQFELPKKPSNKILGVVKTTNKMVQDKLLTDTLIRNTDYTLKQHFNNCRILLKSIIGEPLSKAKIEGALKYHPYKAFEQSEVVRERISCLARLGEVSSRYEFLLGGSPIIWCRSLQSAQEKNPVPEGKDPNKQNLFQTKNNFTGHLFPTRYFWDDAASPRLTSYPGHTIRDGHKGFRKEVFKNFSKHSKTYVYDSDLSSCHPRVLMLFLKEKQAPLLYKSFSEKDLYMDIALKLKEKHPVLRAFTDKLLRKIIKVKCLAMLNGGGLTTEDHINDLVEELYPKDSKEFKAMMIALTKILKVLPIVCEFKKHGNFIHSKKEVYILSHSNKITSTGSSHILCSPVMCGVESLIMTYLMEYVAFSPFEILPLAGIHDGIALASLKELSASQLDSFDVGFSDFVNRKIDIQAPIETVLVGSPS